MRTKWIIRCLTLLTFVGGPALAGSAEYCNHYAESAARQTPGPVAGAIGGAVTGAIPGMLLGGIFGGETAERVRSLAADPTGINRRLRELDQEWDIERM